MQSLTEDEAGLLELLRKSSDIRSDLYDHYGANDSALARELVLYYRKSAARTGFETAVRLIGQAKEKTDRRRGISSLKNIALIHPMLKSIGERSEDAPVSYGYTGDTLINTEGRTGVPAFGTAAQAASQDSLQYPDTAAVLSLSGRRTSSGRGDIIGASTPRTKVVPKEDLISRFGNLIDGADPNRPAVSVSPPTLSSSGTLTELSARITKMDEQTKINTKQLEEIVKKQKEFETVTLKTTDVQQLSAEVLSRLKTQLRFDKSRYS